MLRFRPWPPVPTVGADVITTLLEGPKCPLGPAVDSKKSSRGSKVEQTLMFGDLRPSFSSVPIY